MKDIYGNKVDLQKVKELFKQGLNYSQVKDQLHIKSPSCWWAVLGCVAPFLLFMLGIYVVTSVFIEHTWFIKGDANKFDPISSFDLIKNHAGADVKFVSMQADYVNPDGTLNLNASYKPEPNVEYKFVRELSEPPKNSPPLGAGQNSAGKWYQQVEVAVYRPWEFRSVRKFGGAVSSSYQYFNLGMQRKDSAPTSSSPGEIMDPPKCALADLWEIAIENGAPQSAVAVITYNFRGYNFKISGAQIDLNFDKDCIIVKD